MPKRIIANNRIRAREVRLIDNEGKQLGVFSLTDALKKARESGLDLIQVTEKATPPVCKMMDYGKYAYQQSKKQKKQHHKAGELKNIRLTFNISPHDLETRAKTATKFLKRGNKVRIEMRLRGREKALKEYALNKMRQFLEMIKQGTAIKVEKELKREPRGLTMIITKQ